MIGITGGAGFLGSHLLDALVASGRRVRVLDALHALPGTSVERRKARLRAFGTSVEFVEGDVCSPKVVKRFVDGLDKIYHFARLGDVRDSMVSPRRWLKQNILGTQILTESMARAGTEKLILLSSGAVYGETTPQGATESHTLMPKSTFASSMMASEAVAHSWQAQTEGHLIILRPFNVYGPRMSTERAIRRWIHAGYTGQRALLFGGRAVRDYVHASDFVRIAARARRIESEIPVVLNIASGVGTSQTQLLELLNHALERRIAFDIGPVGRGEVHHSVGSPTRTSQILTLAPTTALEDGLRQMVDWMNPARHSR